MQTPPPDVSVVLISRNQVWNTRRLIDSVLAGTRFLDSSEVIFVDSSSSDGTAEAAAELPITVLRLSCEGPLTPAAGRYIGYKRSRGKYVMFLDGDMELFPGWLEQAFALLESSPEIAAANGVRVDLPVDVQGEQASAAEPARVSDSRFLGGHCLLRRSVLEQVGSFNPFLFSEEEPALVMRIRHAGYRIVRVHRPMVFHYTSLPGEVSTIIGRWRRNLYLGAGQNLRYNLGSEIFWPYVRERAWGIAPLAVILGGTAAAGVGLLRGELIWFGLFAALVVAVAVGDLIRRRSLTRTFASLIERLCLADGTLRGFFLPPLPPESYPANVEVLRNSNAP